MFRHQLGMQLYNAGKTRPLRYRRFQAYVAFLGEPVTAHARPIGAMTADKVAVDVATGSIVLAG